MSKSFLLLLFILCSCGEVYRNKPDHLITPDNMGQLIATSIKEVNNLDIVLYPTDLVSPQGYVLLGEERSSENEVKFVTGHMPNGTKDQFLTGTMKGEDIREFIIKRVRDRFQKDLDVAGMRYGIIMKAGAIISAEFSRDNNLILEDDDYYRVAISNYFFFSGQTFPSYKFRNGMNFSFIPTGNMLSARESVASFIRSPKFESFNFSYSNATFVENNLTDVGFKKTYEIQGRTHLSPLWGHKVKTKGIVTAVANIAWFPRGIDIIIQDPTGDGVDETSDAVAVYLPGDDADIKIGDELEVSGTVFERMYDNDLSKTVIRRVDSFKVLSRNNPRPKAVQVGIGGRPIPDNILSRFVGDLNFKPRLDLDEGIDFWESLESMRIKIRNPSVLGFRGGRENIDSEADRPRGYLSLFLLPDGDKVTKERTGAGGLTENYINGRFNPEIVHLSSNHMTGANMNPQRTIVNIGDIITGDIEGVLTFDSNLFGGGEFAFVIPELQSALTPDKFAKRLTPMKNKPKTLLKGQGNDLTVATFNLENLAGNQPIRIGQVAEIVSKNMNCPDIINLVEIQDDNGIAFIGGASSEETLRKLKESISCAGTDYRWINVDPLYNNEGGQPGGNIRVAMMYNAKRVGYRPWGKPSALDATWITREGNLSTNPGRVLALDKDFKNTRKSTVAQFSFKGERIIVIGNHFNSKLGDEPHFGAHQPPSSKSDKRRIPIATKVNQFVRDILAIDPSTNVIVAGDFNAEFNEASMLRLMGSELVNLMFYGDLVAPEDRYTHNFNGSSTAIDFIFVSNGMLRKNPKMDVLHVNSDFMGRVADHDPVVAQFTFEN